MAIETIFQLGRTLAIWKGVIHEIWQYIVLLFYKRTHILYEIKKSYSLCRPTWPNGKGVKQIPSEAWRNLGCLSQRRVFRDVSFTKRICSLWSVSLDFLVLLHQGKRTDLILIFWFFCIQAKEQIQSWLFYSLGSSQKNVKSNEKNKKIKTFRG